MRALRAALVAARARVPRRVLRVRRASSSTRARVQDARADLGRRPHRSLAAPRRRARRRLGAVRARAPPRSRRCCRPATERAARTRGDRAAERAPARPASANPTASPNRSRTLRRHRRDRDQRPLRAPLPRALHRTTRRPDRTCVAERVIRAQSHAGWTAHGDLRESARHTRCRSRRFGVPARNPPNLLDEVERPASQVVRCAPPAARSRQP